MELAGDEGHVWSLAKTKDGDDEKTDSVKVSCFQCFLGRRCGEIMFQTVFFGVILRTFWCFDRDLSEFAGCIHRCGNPNLGNSPNQFFLRRLRPHLRRLI